MVLTKNPLLLPGPRSPVDPSRLDHVLKVIGYPQDLRYYLVDGFTYGFHLNHTYPDCGLVIHKNHKSCFDHKDFLDQYIVDELAGNRIEGPFDNPPFSNFLCSPLSLVEKKDGKFRVIHNLSFSSDSSLSLNETIPKEVGKVKYELLNHVIDEIYKVGPGASLSKCDVKSAFRILPLHPSVYHLLGFSWNGKFYFDKMLAQGCRQSCMLFECLSTALSYIMEFVGIAGISHILDDFIFIESSSYRCQIFLEFFLDLCVFLGVPIKHEKTIFPCTCLPAHGILVDSVRMMLFLPDDKIQKLKNALNLALSKKKIKIHDLQSLLGQLQFASVALKPGKIFIRRLYNLLCGIPTKLSKFHHVRINKDARKDLCEWTKFLDTFNGSVMILSDHWSSSDVLGVFTDASGKGFGLKFGSHWTFGIFPEDWWSYNIAIKELYPIVLAGWMFGDVFANKKVLFTSDNMSVVYILKSQTSKDPIMVTLVRSLVRASLKYNFIFSSSHIPGKLNTIPDLLSRFDIDKALKLDPTLNKFPFQIPIQFLPQNLILED